MKGAIASVEIFVAEDTALGGARTRLTLTIAAPERSGDGWSCRVALANVHRPTVVSGRDSVAALAAAVDQGRAWVAALRADGATLFRDRTGSARFDFD